MAHRAVDSRIWVLLSSVQSSFRALLGPASALPFYALYLEILAIWIAAYPLDISGPSVTLYASSRPVTAQIFVAAPVKRYL